MSARRKKYDASKEDPDGTVWLTVGEAAKRISRKPQQVRRWCNFWELVGDDVRTQMKHPLPECRRDLDGHGTRYFRESELDALRKFRDQISYGFFSQLSAEAWLKARHREKE